MPDLVTHISVAYLAQKSFKASKYLAVFFAGTILPDILTRPLYIIFPGAYWFIYPLHTPFILILVCLLISYFFEEKIRKTIFISLLAGVFLHLFLDFFQEHLIGVNYWLFPFSDIDVGVSLFWQDDSPYAVPFLLIAIIAIEIVSLITRTRKCKTLEESTK